MQPYQYGNAFAQQKYMREQAKQVGMNEFTPTKTTTLHVPGDLIEEVPTAGTTMDALVGPVTQTEAAARAAIARQRAKMEERLRSPTPSPRKRRNTTPSNKISAPAPIRSPRKRRDTASPNKINTTTTHNGSNAVKPPFLDRVKTKVLRGRKSHANLPQATNSANMTKSQIQTDYDKPLPAIAFPLDEPTYPNLLVLPLPSSSPNPPASPSSSHRIIAHPQPKSPLSGRTPLNPTASPFSPGHDWPLRTPFPILRAPPSSPIYAGDMYLSPSPSRTPSLSPSPLRIPCIKTTRLQQHTRPSAIIATTAAAHGTQYITPVRGGTYGVAGRHVVVTVAAGPGGNGAAGASAGGMMQHAVSMKGSILDVGDFVGGSELGGGRRVEEVSEENEEQGTETKDDVDSNNDNDNENDNIAAHSASPTPNTDALARAVESHVLDRAFAPETRLEGIDGRLSGVERDLARVDAGMSRVEDRLATVEAALGRIEAKFDRFAREHAAQVRFGQSFAGGRYPPGPARGGRGWGV